MKKLIYQAGPLFSDAEKEWHARLSKKLEKAGHEVIWPGALLTDAQVAAAGGRAPELLFQTCKAALDRCCELDASRNARLAEMNYADSDEQGGACVVALLDGPQVDDGTAWEIGYACARGLPVYGIRTDSRQAGETRFNRVNSMVECSLSGLASTVQELLKLIR